MVKLLGKLKILPEATGGWLSYWSLAYRSWDFSFILVVGRGVTLILVEIIITVLKSNVIILPIMLVLSCFSTIGRQATLLYWFYGIFWMFYMSLYKNTSKVTRCNWLVKNLGTFIDMITSDNEIIITIRLISLLTNFAVVRFIESWLFSTIH